MPTSVAGTFAMYTYLIGYWSYLFLSGIAAWPRLPLTTWLKYVFIKAVYAVFWPVLVGLESLEFGW